MPTASPRSSGPGRLRRLREAGGVAGPVTRYATPFIWGISGAAITPATPTNTGGAITSYAIASGALPTGLSLNGSSGAITGTPTGSEATGAVVLTVIGAGGGTTIRLEWATVFVPPVLSYAGSPFSWVPLAAIATANPTVTGGGVDATGGYAVQAGALPGGVALDADTGQLTGTPLLPASGSVTIRASGPGGHGDAVLAWTVAA